MSLLDALTLFARPLNRIAVALDNIHQDALRYFDYLQIPERPSDAAVAAHAAEPAIGEQKEEWELAIEEEVLARRQAVNRDEQTVEAPL